MVCEGPTQEIDVEQVKVAQPLLNCEPKGDKPESQQQTRFLALQVILLLLALFSFVLCGDKLKPIEATDVQRAASVALNVRSANYEYIPTTTSEEDKTNPQDQGTNVPALEVAQLKLTELEQEVSKLKLSLKDKAADLMEAKGRLSSLDRDMLQLQKVGKEESEAKQKLEMKLSEKESEAEVAQLKQTKLQQKVSKLQLALNDKAAEVMEANGKLSSLERDMLNVKSASDTLTTLSKTNPQDQETSVPSCRRTWPIIPKWHNLDNPDNATYTTASCELPHDNAAGLPLSMSKEENSQCLAGRRIFLLGNSIARQFAYHVPLLLGSTGDVPDRESQKEHCPKAYGRGGCAIDAPFNVRVRSYWFLYFNGKPKGQVRPDNPRKETKWENDNCSINKFDSMALEDCLVTKVFEVEPTKESDLLVTNVGILYSMYDPAGVDDIWGWRVEELRTFIRTLDRVYKGTVVWMTQSKQEHKSIEFTIYDERAQMLDAQIVPIIQAETNWIIYDGYHVTQNLIRDRRYFVDPIHHPGRLTELGWQFILGYFCPTAPPVAVES